MAERSGPSRTLACILVGLGALLLVVAHCSFPPTRWANWRRRRSTSRVTTVAEGVRGERAQLAALVAPARPQVDTNVPLVSQRFLTVEEPSDADEMTSRPGRRCAAPTSRATPAC